MAASRGRRTGHSGAAVERGGPTRRRPSTAATERAAGGSHRGRRRRTEPTRPPRLGRSGVGIAIGIAAVATAGAGGRVESGQSGAYRAGGTGTRRGSIGGSG